MSCLCCGPPAPRLPSRPGQGWVGCTRGGFRRVDRQSQACRPTAAHSPLSVQPLWHSSKLLMGQEESCREAEGLGAGQRTSGGGGGDAGTPARARSLPVCSSSLRSSNWRSMVRCVLASPFCRRGRGSRDAGGAFGGRRRLQARPALVGQAKVGWSRWRQSRRQCLHAI